MRADNTRHHVAVKPRRLLLVAFHEASCHSAVWRLYARMDRKPAGVTADLGSGFGLDPPGKRGTDTSKALLFSHKKPAILIWVTNMSTKAEVWQGTLALMVLKTLNAMGPQHGYGIARRIEQTSDNLLSINHGTLYPVLLKLEQEGAIASEWGVSENNRRAKFYQITRAGQKQLASEVTQWAQATEIVARFIALKGLKA
jgi:PadR family transcriptional regulator PadR